MKLTFEFGDGEVRSFEIDEGYGTGEYFKIRDITSMYPQIGKKIEHES
jgi:hypothetical protein